MTDCPETHTSSYPADTRSMAVVAHQALMWPPDVQVVGLSFDSPSQIDSQLARLEEYSRQLRTARNAVLPVSRLPAEVLSLIFLCLLDDPKDLFSVPSTKRIRRITHVCRYWRAVALGCSVLWTWVEVADVHPDWTAEMLRRSQRSTISFRAKLFSPSPHAMEACALVLAQTDRLGEIHISGDHKTIEKLLKPVTSCAPRLTSLITDNPGWRAGADIAWLDPSLLQHGAPRLKRIELRKCAVSWAAPFLRLCPEIHTFLVESREPSQSAPSQMLEVLQNMPRLKTLRLDKVGGIASLGARPEECTTSLRELQDLTLGGPTHDVAALLSHLDFPTSTSMSLRCICADKSDGLPSLVAALSSRSTASTSKLPTHAFHISCDAIQMTMFAEPKSRLIEDEALWDATDRGSTSLSLIAGPDHLHTSATIVAVTDAFALKDVDSLLLDDQEGLLDQEASRAILARMPNLTTIHIRHDAAAYLVSALSTACERDVTERNVLVPHLESLILEEVDMNWNFGPLPFMHALQEAQFVRCGYGRIIDELRIRRCMNIGPKDVAVLNHLFADVEWDAFEAYVSESSGSEGWPDETEVWGDYWEFEGIHWHS